MGVYAIITGSYKQTKTFGIVVPQYQVIWSKYFEDISGNPSEGDNDVYLCLEYKSIFGVNNLITITSKLI